LSGVNNANISYTVQIIVWPETFHMHAEMNHTPIVFTVNIAATLNHTKVELHTVI